MMIVSYHKISLQREYITAEWPPEDHISEVRKAKVRECYPEARHTYLLVVPEK